MAENTSSKARESSCVGGKSTSSVAEPLLSCITFDGNNNANAMRLIASRKRIHSNESNDAVNERRLSRSETSGSESDDWHLLDIEEQSSSSDELSSNKVKPNERLRRVGENKMKFINIEDTIKLEHSSSTIHLVCATYSLLVPASFLTLVTLITLAFSRFWLVPAIYLTYIILDRNSCNKGKFRRN